jgi:hypothetical protein
LLYLNALRANEKYPAYQLLGAYYLIIYRYV